MSGFKESALQGSPSDQDHFIELIQRISIGFPSIVVKNSLPTNAATDFSKNLLYILPKLSQEMKGLVLESFISVADQIGGLFVELKAKVFHLWPHHDEVFQTSLLLVLNSLAPTLDIGDIDSFMDIIIHIFPQHSSSKCRSAFYTLMLKLYAQPSVQTSGNAHIKIMQAIILGLRDEDAQIKTAISSFINTTSLSLEFTKRVQQLVQNYYLPELEESFLHYTLYMTLELCRGSRAWDKPLFDQALSDVARFNDVIINMDWRGGDALSMRPLFASTQGDAAKYSSDIVKLRQTQAMQWTPTINFDASQARSIFSLSGSQIDDGSSAGGGGTSSIKQFNQSASASIQRARQFQRGPSGYKLSDKFVFARNAEQK